jgi:hypothetical protein
MRFRRPIQTALVGCLLLGAHPALAARFLAPHRAVYDLSLIKATDKSGITGLTGRMVYEFRGSACDGYTVTFRFVTRIQTDDNTRLTDQQTTTFEDAAGKTFRFVTKSFVDETLNKEVRGTATHDAKGLTLVKLEKPQPSSLSLPAAEFPTQQLIDMLGRAEKGEKFYTVDLFDGSDSADRVMATTVVIGKQAALSGDDPEKAALTAVKLDKAARLDRYWPVTVAYFDTTKEARKEGEETPTYRISFKLLDNGITRDLTMDYGDFSMKGKLVNLALFKPGADSCKQ